MRSTHATHLGPLCPKCHRPLAYHTSRRAAGSRWRGVYPGEGGRPCFEIGTED